MNYDNQDNGLHVLQIMFFEKTMVEF